MKQSLFFPCFDRISDAPDAVRRLRQFVLELAVRGRLVAQDPNDEPASVLLARLQDQKKKITGTRKGRDNKPQTATLSKETAIPFPIPKSWVWTSIGEIFEYDAGIKREPRQLDPERWLLELEDIEKDTSAVLARLKVKDRDSLSTKSEFMEGDILYGKLRPYLNKVVIADEPGYSTTEIVSIRPFLPLCSEYCALALRSPDFVDYVERLGRGTKMPRLRTPDAIVAPFPLPPLAEQYRIVAKAHEMRDLCNKLETEQRDRETRKGRLTAASVYHLSNGATPEIFRGYATFYLKQFDLLTSSPEQIKQLRQVILGLAVRGSLVPQQDHVESACELLKRIQIEKQRLIAAGTIPKQRLQPDLREDELPFCVPNGWTWVRLGEIADVQDPNPSHRMPHYVSEKGIPFISSENFIDGDAIDYRIGKRVAQQTLQEQINRFRIVNGSIAFSRIGTIGKSRFLPTERTYALSHALCVINPLDPSSLNMRYLRMALGAEAILAAAHTGTRSIGVPDLGMAVIRNMPIPLPPLVVQHLVVTKVEELMSLCDQIEQGLSKIATGTAHLRESVLYHSLNDDMPVARQDLQIDLSDLLKPATVG